MIFSIQASVSSPLNSEAKVATDPKEPKKSKLLEQVLADPRVGEKSSYLYAFVGRVRPSIWSYLVVGAFSAIFMKSYQVLIDKDSLVLVRINLLGKVDTVDRIPFSEVQSFTWKRKFLIHRIQLVLKNGRKMTMEANHRILAPTEATVSSDEALNFVQAKVS